LHALPGAAARVGEIPEGGLPAATSAAKHRDMANRHDDDARAPFTRREFLVTALATGFAAAVRPSLAEAVIQTDKAGILAGPVTISAPDRTIPGYRALPAKRKKPPIILVVEEIFGVHEHIQDICRRLAKEGYFAIAPELFARQGDPTKLTDPKAIVDTIVSKTPDAQVMADLDAAVTFAAKADADAGKVGITGFCWGGRITWLYAAHQPKVNAGVAWYGRLDGQRNELQPTYPIDVASKLKAPVLGLYGGKDDGIPPDQVLRMQAALKTAGGTSEIRVYKDAPHAFYADYRPSYREADAKDAWGRALAWFRKHGVA
jgi:carboxymethylenebutenolidase